MGCNCLPVQDIIESLEFLFTPFFFLFIVRTKLDVFNDVEITQTKGIIKFI